MRIYDIISEEKVNYNFRNQHWQIRSDDSDNAFLSEVPKIILQDARPYVDYDAHEEGKKVYAYLQGTVVTDPPDFSEYTAYPIKFVKDELSHPFVYIHNNRPVKRADYIVFDKNTVTAYLK